MTDKVEEVAVEEDGLVDQQDSGQEDANLSLKDIAMMLSIIDVCSKRGAFEGSDLETVGSTRTKIVKFLDAAEKANADAATDEDGTDTEVTED